ncbi:hypothetical protein BH18ACT4_BH18ACT4_00360 [soil metagenome]
MTADISTARDRAWVDAVRAGDQRAFTELYREHAVAVRVAATDLVRDKEAVADIVQETFTRALERLDSLRDPDRLRPWLLSSARNCAIDVQRRRQREPLADPEGGNDAPSVGQPGPDVQAELAELTGLVDGCVFGLSSRDATAVMMMTGLGFSSVDVAGVLGVSSGAAKVIAHRARARLWQSLALQLLVRSRARRCPEFQARYDSRRPIEAARHAQGCTLCRGLAEAEVSLYELQTTDLDALVSERVD